uniref:D-alanine--D-alanine ligase n=1 Tax=Candidatus Kentrum sp. FM TaxID=2126340 RepID=A0A450SDH3_9GAMM|nr:MAG: D-alanine-D-alanine ligase [Candidatus Kentron sp. FM]VFJ54624.1 MAG: D-alanine-D-alanine ligase [Candidatus Kentron sp. FM]VFK10549.1 MAG: D-alanine-D-alanine ligase [Candidatus Kentron sp. FM]
MNSENYPNIPSVNHPTEFGKVAVLFGGDSAERTISLESGRAVLDALRARQVDVHGLDVRQDVVEQLARDRYDRAFVVLHGRGGEDGTVQGALESIGLAYTGTGILGSALSMDKARTKYLWQATGIPTPPFRVVESEEALMAAAKELGFPLCVKPVHEGSSIGASKVTDSGKLTEAWQLATRYDPLVLAERWIEGVEYTAAILDRVVFPLIRLETPRIFYDFDAKYRDHAGTRYHCPCGLGADREKSFADIAFRAFTTVGACGWGRVDFLCDASGEPWFIEVNTVPGMTSHSLVPMAARAVGMSFEQLAWRILETSL